MGVNPIMSRNVPISNDPLNLTVFDESMFNQHDETDVQVNFVDQFLSNPTNAKMVNEIIESCKNLIFTNMVAQEMIVTSLHTLVTTNP